MKRVMATEENAKTRLFDDVKRVEILVRLFKSSDWNKEMSPGAALVQEVETRFATTFAVVERFRKARD